MANTLANIARVVSATTGTGTLTLGAAVQGFNTFADAGITNGQTVTYAIEDYTAGVVSAREVGEGVYNSAGPTLTRGTVYSSTSAGAKINCSGSQQVFITVAKEDINSLGGALADGDYGDIVVSGSGTVLSIDSAVATTFGRSLMDDADAATARATLGLTIGTAVREKLTGNRTYYVRTDGSDSNNGLANTAGGAFLTIQAAVNAFFLLDVGGYSVTIQVADGTYTGAVAVNGFPPGCTASNPLVFQGNFATPANCIISTTAANAFTISSGAEAYIQGFTIQTTTSGTGCEVSGHARVIFGPMVWGAHAGYHMEAKDGANIITTGNYSITGGGVAHQHVTSNGYVLYTGGTITLTGTPAWSSYYVGANNAYVQYGSTTFSGSATGRRHYIHNNASVYTDGSYDANFFPGNVAGILEGASCIDDFDGSIALTNLGLRIRDTDESHNLTIAPGSNLSSARTLTLTTGDANRTLDISAGSVTISTAGAALIDDADNTAQRTTLGLGTAATQNTGTSGANIPLLSSDNTWSGARNSFGYSQGTGAVLEACLDTAFGAPLGLVSKDASASRSPNFLLQRISPSPAANDAGGAFLFQMSDDALALQTFATVGAIATAVTAGTISARVRFQTQVAGSFAERCYVGGGFVVGSPTSGDLGAGTINAVTFYENGTSLAAKYQPLDADLTTIAGLAAPGADRILFWDHSASAYAYLTAGTGLTITGTTITASGATVADSDYGDVTVSSSGTVWTIDNDAVTYAKLQNTGAGNVVLTRADAAAGDIGETALAASQLLGRGSTGNVAAITLGSGLSMSGTTLSASGGGGGTYGTATLNFGSVPGTNIVTTTITGQTGILSGSTISAWLMAEATATHNAYEHMIVPLRITCGNIVAGVGFDIVAVSDLRLTGTFTCRWEGNY